ncbi:MAG: hypothetical protein WA280_06120, partial [Xanthobacteraceae bacterium]
MDYFDYEAAIKNHWLQSGIGPREAAAKLQPACGDVALDEDTVRNLETWWQQKRDALSIVYGILTGPWNRLAGFDCEDVESPADHTTIVGYLGATTANKFVAENVVQSIEPNGELKLSLRHEGNPFVFTFEDNGSWRNLSGLLVGLNRVLEELHIPERFIELYAGDGPGVVVFALPDKFALAARE